MHPPRLARVGACLRGNRSEEGGAPPPSDERASEGGRRKSADGEREAEHAPDVVVPDWLALSGISSPWSCDTTLSQREYSHKLDCIEVIWAAILLSPPHLLAHSLSLAHTHTADTHTHAGPLLSSLGRWDFRMKLGFPVGSGASGLGGSVAKGWAAGAVTWPTAQRLGQRRSPR